MTIDDNAKYWVFAWYILYQGMHQCCDTSNQSGDNNNNANGSGQVVTVIETISVPNPMQSLNVFTALPAQF